MADQNDYVPPKVWSWDKESGGRFANINRPIAGPTHDKDLPVGKHPLQLYSLGTPNGVKVTVMLEELLAAGHAGAEYDAWLINIGDGDQFSSGFVDANPNSKIPAHADPGVRIGRDPDPSRRKVRGFPSHRPRAARRNAVLADVADGERAVPGRRLRPLLCLCAVQAGISDQPLCDGSEAPDGCARPPSGRQ
jgi:hypothetical protein